MPHSVMTTREYLKRYYSYGLWATKSSDKNSCGFIENNLCSWDAGNDANDIDDDDARG